jgi:hypothetical protein
MRFVSEAEHMSALMRAAGLSKTRDQIRRGMPRRVAVRLNRGMEHFKTEVIVSNTKRRSTATEAYPLDGHLELIIHTFMEPNSNDDGKSVSRADMFAALGKIIETVHSAGWCIKCRPIDFDETLYATGP